MNARHSAWHSAAAAGCARCICAGMASHGCSPAAWRLAVPWKTRASICGACAAARWATCCSATRPLPAARSKPCATLTPGCPPRCSRPSSGPDAPASAAASWTCWSPRSFCLRSGKPHSATADRPYDTFYSGALPMYQKLLQSSNRLHPRAFDFIQLMRLDRPIGTYLQLWPTLGALWTAGEGSPSVKNTIIFVLAVILMRAAGCVINDFADRNFDGHVSRTKNRPLATGKVTTKQAWILFAVLVALSFALVLLTNAATIWLSFGALAVASLYPFMKRYTHYPQVVLGAAFS